MENKKGNRGGKKSGRGGSRQQQQRDQSQAGVYPETPPREQRGGPPSAESRPQQGPQHRAYPPQQFPPPGPSPQMFRGPSPVRAEPPMRWGPPRGQHQTTSRPPAFSPPVQRQPSPTPQSTVSQQKPGPVSGQIEKQVEEKPVQKPAESKVTPVRDNQPEATEKPTTSESTSVTETAGKKSKKKRKNARGTGDKPLEESLSATLVVGGPSKKPDTKPKSEESKSTPQKTTTRTTPEESKSTPQKTATQEPAQTTNKSLVIPKRGIVSHSPKYFDTDNRPVAVNFIRVDLDTNLNIYQYSVAITPERRKNLYREAVRLLFQRNGIDRHPAYDGNTLLFVARRRLEFPGGTQSFTGNVEVSHEDGRPMQYNITINFARETNLRGLLEYMRNGSSANPFDVQALDIAVMHAAISNRALIKAGRSFFTPPNPRGPSPTHLGNGLDLCYGHSQSIVIPQLSADGKPHLYLNVDVAHKGFPKAQPVLNYIADEFFRGNMPANATLQGWQLNTAKSFLKGLKIQYSASGLGQRSFKADSLGDSARNARFTPGENQRETTVEQYFRTTRNVTLRYPMLPCIESRGRLYPIELCHIAPNQAVNKELDGRQTDVMVRNAARPTTERRQRIENSIRNVPFATDPCVREFGLIVDDQFETVPKHVLKAPSIQYSRSTVRVMNGEWRTAPGRDTFIAPVNLTKWVLINTDDRLNVRNMISEFKKVGPTCGVNVADPVERPLFGQRISELDFASIFREFKSKGAQFFMVVINNTDQYMYGKIKRAAEINVGVLTQCIRSRTASNPRFTMTAGNMLLKLNAKISGVNHTLAPTLKPEILNDDVMLVGADVTHPKPRSTELSIAAVAASHDEYGFQYNMEYRLQPPKKEIILDIEEMMISRIEFYKQKNRGKLPKRIIYYRDGVSESQFQQVLTGEVTAIRRACARVQAPHRITITVVVVQKRHHTRFFPAENDADGSKNVNVKAGTVVDEKITHPTELDFYLVSHKSIQGTARPTKYHLLYDDSSPVIDQETLQRLTYYLCHMFARCNRSVSYPAPTYYAHLAAFRAKAWWADDMSRSRYDLGNLRGNQEQRGRVRDDVINMTPMFFI